MLSGCDANLPAGRQVKLNKVLQPGTKNQELFFQPPPGLEAAGGVVLS
jgi:hypothetical protein